MTRLLDELRGKFFRAFAGSMAVAIPARFAQLGMAVILARRFGPEGYGLFTYALGLGLLGGRVGALGWPTLMMRFIPAYIAQADWSGLKGLLRAAYPVVIAAGITVGLAMAGLAWGLGRDHKLFEGLVLGAVLLPVMGLRSLVRNMLAGYKRPSDGIMVDELLPPALICLVTPLLGIRDAAEAVWIYGVLSLLAIAYGVIRLRRVTPAELGTAQAEMRLRRWMSIALPALVGMSAKLIMNRSDVIMIAPLSTLEEVSFYGVALRVTFVQTFPMVVLSTVLSPQISSHVAAGRMRRASRLFTASLLFSGVLSGVIALGLVVFREPLMTLLFGAAYQGSGQVLAVLALAQIPACLGISTTAFLLMNGREKSFGAMTLAGLALNIGGNFLLIPGMGAIGASWATAASATLLTGMQMYLCLRIIRDSPATPPPSEGTTS